MLMSILLMGRGRLEGKGSITEVSSLAQMGGSAGTLQNM